MADISDKKYNVERKKLLLMEDQKQEVTNLSLAFFDLTQYIRPLNFDCSLFEKGVSIHQEDRRISHLKNENFYFSPEQELALEEIKKDPRVILEAPTSFGKTLIVIEYIFREKPNNVVYIVPTNALSYELERKIKTNPSFSSYVVFDKAKATEKPANGKTDGKGYFFIGTQERYLEVKDVLPKKIDLFVIDEAYKLQETVAHVRAYKLSETFLDAIDTISKKIVLLSPNAIFTGFERFNFKIYQTTFNSVDKVINIVGIPEFFRILSEKCTKEKTILFCQTPDAISSVVDRIPTISNRNSPFADELSKDFHPDWTVVKLLRRGILCHHGLMPKYVQNRMINLFNNDENYPFLVGTNSISEGINTPAKNVFIHPETNILDHALLIKNTIGRAGRLGLYPIGHIFSTSPDLVSVDQEDITVALSLTKDEDTQEILDTRDSVKIAEFCKQYSIDEAFYDVLVSSYKISLSRLKKVFTALKKDYRYPGIANLPFMAHHVFNDDYTFYSAKYDSIYIRGALQPYYIIDKETKQYIYLNSFDDKITFFRMKYQEKMNKDLSNSSIVDGYMKFLYSILDYYICPIVNIAKDIVKKYPNFVFGKNVSETIKSFSRDYYETFFGIDLDSLSENQQKILLSLREYGLPIKNTIDISMINDIEKELNERFSMFDIVSAMKKIFDKNGQNSDKFKNILLKYFK